MGHIAAAYPFEKIAIDLMVPLPETLTGNKHLLVVCDYFSKWVELLALPDIRAEIQTARGDTRGQSCKAKSTARSLLGAQGPGAPLSATDSTRQLPEPAPSPNESPPRRPRPPSQSHQPQPARRMDRLDSLVALHPLEDLDF